LEHSDILVTEENLRAVLRELAPEKVLAVDTETTGFDVFKSSKLFSIIVASKTKAYYFNFNWYSELGVERYQLPDPKVLEELFSTPRLWVFQNAKFDLHFLNKAGVLPVGEYYDTQVGGRILYNIHESYSLDAMSERELNERKDDGVMKWLESNKCYTMVPAPGRKKMTKNYNFDQVPFDIISKYALKDARLTMALYEKQVEKYAESDLQVVSNEMRLIDTLYDMEQVGVKIDREYVTKASAFELARVEKYVEEWGQLIGTELVDSGEYLKPIFEGLGFTIPWTEKMEPNVDGDVIASIDHESARILEKYRDAEKRYTTLMGILSAADDSDVVHTSFKQAGTVTGRMSSFAPNLQNLSADDTGEYPIRRAFVPRPGYFFVSIDYQQMEFRLLLEYSNEQELIGKIMQGHDPHDSTAELTGLTRKAAKTLNFGLVYGMGVKKLGKAIGVDEREAKAFKAKYFEALPRVREFLWGAARNQERRGFTWNWFGRRFFLREKKFSYRAPNSIIQGGCADVCKLAMNAIHTYLRDKASRMILQVHDEILFEVSFDEVDIVGLLKETMEKAYPHKNIPLTCSVAYSLKSFHDMTEVDSVGEIASAIGKDLSDEGSAGSKDASEHVVL
jgi:DNA polymerase-1